MALLSLITSQNFGALLQWKFLVLVTIPLIAIYYFQRKKSTSVSIKQYSHFPQPEEADPVRGHWPWIERIAAEGDPRRMFGMFGFTVYLREQDRNREQH